MRPFQPMYMVSRITNNGCQFRRAFRNYETMLNDIYSHGGNHVSIEIVRNRLQNA